MPLLEYRPWKSKLRVDKAMFQKSIKVVIGLYCEFKELYLRPNYFSNIAIKKVIRDGMGRLQVC